MSSGTALEQRQTESKGTDARGPPAKASPRWTVKSAPGTRTGKAIVMRKPDPAARAADPAARATLPAQRGVNYRAPPRPSIELIVEKMSVSLDKGRGSVSGARSALSHVRNVEPKLTRDEFMTVLNGLDRKDRLGDFLLINAEPDILKLLVRYEVPWSFILSNWKPNIYDASLFLAGVAAGLADDFIEGISFIAQIVASPFMDNIAGAAQKLGVIDAKAAQKIINDRDAFWDGIGGFIDAVSFEAIKNIGKGWLDETVEAFYKLDFYTAGNKIGRLIGTLWTLPVVWKAGKTIVRGVGKLAKKYQPLLARGLKELSEVDYRALRRLVASLPELTLQQFVHMVPLEALRAALAKLDQLIPQGTLGPQLAAATAGTAAEGGSFAVIGDSIAVWVKNGEALGRILLSKSRKIAGSSAKIVDDTSKARARTTSKAAAKFTVQEFRKMVNSYDVFVYRITDGYGNVIKYGTSNDPIKRIYGYKGEAGSFARMEVISGPHSRAQALRLESKLIDEGFELDIPTLNERANTLTEMKEGNEWMEVIETPKVNFDADPIVIIMNPYLKK